MSRYAKVVLLVVAMYVGLLAYGAWAVTEVYDMLHSAADIDGA